MDESNPYKPPSYDGGMSLPGANANRRTGLLTYAAWSIAFVVNMAVPLLFSASLTEEHGKLGMSVAVLVLFTWGCTICATARKLAVVLIAGAVLVGLSQIFPLLQIIAGMIGMGVGAALGLAETGDDTHPPRLVNEYGGFVVTLITGGILKTASACSGLWIRWITPARWWHRSEPPGGA